MSAPGFERLVSSQAIRHVLGRPSRHPINQLMYDEQNRGERIANAVTAFLGSWRFIVIQTAVVLAWIAGNVILLFHFDPYPFIALNLAFSTQAAYAAPLILLASNRAALRDRLTLEHAAKETDLEEQQNDQILAAIAKLDERLARIEAQARA
jgi:uncharacterized membrane protein